MSSLSPQAPVTAIAAVALVNHVLGQNAWARAALRVYTGRRLTFVAAPLVFSMRITPEGLVEAISTSDGQETGPHQGFSEGSPAGDVRLSMPLWSLPQFALDRSGTIRQVRIEGDAEFAQLLGQLVPELRWDAEDDLARVVGDVAAGQLMKGAKSFHAYVLDVSQRLAETGTAYLVDEDPTLVRRQRLEELAARIAALRDDTARLEKRLVNRPGN